MNISTCCLILAAGNSLRFNDKNNKLFYKINNISIIEFTLNEFQKIFKKNEIYIVINHNISNKYFNLLQDFTSNNLIYGGSERSHSVKKGIKNIAHTFNNVLIHDGARPLIKKNLIIKIKKEIEKNNIDVVVPYIKLDDSIKYKYSNKIKSLNRDNLLSIQTPQAIRLNDCNIKHIIKNKNYTKDESVLFEKNNKFKIKYILGDRNNFKITSKSDMNKVAGLMNCKLRIGNAFDLHKLSKGKELILGGIKIPSQYRLVGHSDGDVIIHSIIDAILGALSKNDLGSYFPSIDKKLKNIDSTIMLKEIIKINNFYNTIISNIDITIITETVRLEKYKIKIKNSISKILMCPMNKISIKAKTSDGVGIIGRSNAIACWVTMIIYKT